MTVLQIEVFDDELDDWWVDPQYAERPDMLARGRWNGADSNALANIARDNLLLFCQLYGVRETDFRLFFGPRWEWKNRPCPHGHGDDCPHMTYLDTNAASGVRATMWVQGDAL